MLQYFALLREVYDDLDFDGHPERIYNMGETGVPLDPRPPKVVAKKGQRKVRYRCSGQKGQITVIGCASATGHTIPPFIIFAAKQLNPNWMKDELAGTRYAVSDNGWIDQDLFHFWLTEHFLENAVASRPLLLLLDGHSSHFKPDTIRFAKDHNVVVFCLPPHTTHECQPLDCSLFGPLKVHWRQECHQFHQKFPCATITKFNFNGLFKEAWLKAISPENVIGGFRKAGIYPFDPKRVSALNGVNKSGDGTCSRENSASSGDESSSESSDHDDDKGDSNSNEALYQKRYEEGYDLFDPEYVSWLEQHHPEAVPADRYTLTSTTDASVSKSQDSTSILEHFKSVRLCEPLPRPQTSDVDGGALPHTSISSSSSVLHPNVTDHSFVESATPTDSGQSSDVLVLTHNSDGPLSRSMATPAHVSDSTSSSSSSCSSSSSGLPHRNSTPQSSKVSPLSGCSSSSSNKSIISKFLPSLPAVTPSRSSSVTQSQARVLTSKECLERLEEKEKKKQQDKEEKEKRKLERERKKQEREQEMKRKAEERAKKAEEKAKREEEKAKKAQERALQRAKKAAEKATASLKGKAAPTRRKQPRTENNTCTSAHTCTAASSDTGTSPTAESEPKPKAPRLIEDSINTDECCACFGLYTDDIGTGREWLECACQGVVTAMCPVLPPATAMDS